MRIPRKNVFEEHVYQAFATGIEGPPRRRQLRASSVPYCPVLDLINPREVEIADIFGTYFTSTGTSFHSTVQLFLSQAELGKYMWGNWKCVACGHEWKLTYKPDACPKRCNSIPIYCEVPLRVGPHTGTCDHVAHYRHKLWVTNDHKTCARIPKEPMRQHLLQVQTYNTMLEVEHGIRVDAYFITYFERTGLKWKAFGPYSTKKSRQRVRDWLFRAIAGFKAVSKFNKGDETALNEVVKLRPCHTEEDFDDYMSRKKYLFDGKPCPMLENCTRGDKHLKAVLKRGRTTDAKKLKAVSRTRA